MSDLSAVQHCPQCAAELPPGSLEGLCPRCLMAQIMEPTQAGESAPRQVALTPAELAPHFPQLEILECLGRGGMGVVYKARQKSLNRFVALKLLAPERADDPQFAARFEKEAQALAALNHPNIVGVYDFGQAGGFYFLLMEFVDGVNLRQAMQAGRFTPEQALAVVPPVCEALQYAHEHGIVHCDIKPENLLLDKEGRVKIADFGIAKMLGSDNDAVVREEGTQRGTPASAAGTPQYMAPEQREHHVTDHRADIYSLGVVLYEMLTGERPKDNIVPPSKRVQVDIRIDEIVLRALEKTPELRYQTAGEFRTQVEAVTNEGPATGVQTEKPSLNWLEKRALAREIYSHMTEPERKQMAFHSVLFGIWNGATWFAPVFGGMMVASRFGVILGLCCSVVGFCFYPFLLKLQRELMCSTAWAKAQGITPEQFRLTPANRVGSRFSRTAIWGALCLLLLPAGLVLNTVGFVFNTLSTLHNAPLPVNDPWRWIWGNPGVALVLLAQIGTTILGWISVTQIRRSAGKLHGMWLAVFDGLLFPLLALDALIVSIDLSGRKHIVGPGLTPGVTMVDLNIPGSVAVLLLALIIVVDFLIIRAVWRAVNKPLNEGAPKTEAGLPRRKRLVFATVAVPILLFAFFFSFFGLRYYNWRWGGAEWHSMPMQWGGDSPKDAAGVLRIAEVKREGRVVIFRIACESGQVPMNFQVSYSGQNLESLPSADAVPSVTPLYAPTSTSIPPSPYAGMVLVGASWERRMDKITLTKPGEFTLGFVLPDEARAKMAVQQARDMYPPARPCHLTKSAVLVLFYQTRRTSEKGSESLQALLNLEFASGPSRAAPTTSKTSAPAFGPVFERDLASGVLIDFDQDAQREMPVFFKDGEKEKVRVGPAQSAALAMKSGENTGMDAFYSEGHFTTFDMTVKALVSEDWDHLTAVRVEELIQNIARETHPQRLFSAGVLDSVLGIAGAGAFAFQTREGGKGILQIIGRTEQGVKLRYKMVQGFEEKKPALHDASKPTAIEKNVRVKPVPGVDASVGNIKSVTTTHESAEITLEKAQASLAFVVGEGDRARVIVHECGRSSSPFVIRVMADDRGGKWWDHLRVTHEGEADSLLPMLPDDWLPSGHVVFLPSPVRGEDGRVIFAEIESAEGKTPLGVRAARPPEMAQAVNRELPETCAIMEISIESWIYALGKTAPEKTMKLPVLAARDLVGSPDDAFGWPDLDVKPGKPSSWSRGMTSSERIDVTATLSEAGVRVEGTLTVPMIDRPFANAAQAFRRNAAAEEISAKRKLLRSAFAATLGRNDALVIPIATEGLFPETLVACLTALPQPLPRDRWVPPHLQTPIQFDGWVLTWPRSEHAWFAGLFDYKDGTPGTIARHLERRKGIPLTTPSGEFVAFMPEAEMTSLLKKFRDHPGVKMSRVEPFAVKLTGRGFSSAPVRTPFAIAGERGSMQVRFDGKTISPIWTWESPVQPQTTPSIGVRSGGCFSALLPGPAEPPEIRMMILRCVNSDANTAR
jgi:tRNA A-37 threonylcarbamoyl transferase component Bud32